MNGRCKMMEWYIPLREADESAWSLHVWGGAYAVDLCLLYL